MIHDVSGPPFQLEPLLVTEQIGDIEWRVGMCSQEGRIPLLICYLLLVAMETDDFLPHHDGAHGIENWTGQKWKVRKW